MSDHSPSQSHKDRTKRPLDRTRLDALALFYVGRYATSQKKLRDYLRRKVKENGWVDDTSPPIDDIVARMITLKYLDDEAYATMKAEGMTRRGYGLSRVKMALRQAGISENDAHFAETQSRENAKDAALAFARRKRIGPYARITASADDQRKAIAAMCRAGHSFEIAHQIIGNADDFVQDTAD